MTEIKNRVEELREQAVDSVIDYIAEEILLIEGEIRLLEDRIGKHQSRIDDLSRIDPTSRQSVLAVVPHPCDGFREAVNRLQ